MISVINIKHFFKCFIVYVLHLLIYKLRYFGHYIPTKYLILISQCYKFSTCYNMILTLFIVFVHQISLKCRNFTITYQECAFGAQSKKKDFNDSEKKKNFSYFLFSVFSPSPTHILAQSFLPNHLCSPIQAQPLCCEFSFAENSNYPEVTYSYILHRSLASAYRVHKYGFIKTFANETRNRKNCWFNHII